MNRLLLKLYDLFSGIFPGLQKLKAAHLDFLAHFTIKGKIIDAESRDRLSGAGIFFIDTGLDEKPSHKNAEQTNAIGHSDGNGDVLLECGYSWGILASSPSPASAAGSFQIEVRCKGYKTRTIGFNLSELEQREGSYIVNLEKVLMDLNSS